MNEKIVVSIASWPPRIKYVADCVKSLLDQSRKPDSIEVNLSRVEFPNGLDDLPDDLLTLIADKSVTINWEEGNTQVFRKLAMTVKKYLGQQVTILTCDDDILYAHGYIERMVDNLGDYDCYSSEPGVVGCKTAYNCKAFKKDFYDRINDDLVRYGVDDTYYHQYLVHNNARCKFERDAELDRMLSGNGNAPIDTPNSSKMGGYTRERCEAAFRASIKALGLL